MVVTLVTKNKFSIIFSEKTSCDYNLADNLIDEFLMQMFGIYIMMVIIFLIVKVGQCHGAQNTNLKI